jgi:hypothetical protein
MCSPYRPVLTLDPDLGHVHHVAHPTLLPDWAQDGTVVDEAHRMETAHNGEER